MCIVVRIIAVTILVTGSAGELIAQHNILYRSHLLHQVLVNPATAGSEFIPVAALSYQKQWLGINRSPHTLVSSTSLRIGNFDFYNPKMFINKSKLRSKERIGIGGAVYSDRNGPISMRGINLSYAYHLAFSGSRLSFGLSGTAEQSVLDGSAWDPITPGDPLLGGDGESFLQFNANTGVYYYGPRYYAGFAVGHLIPLENKIEPGKKVKQDFIFHGGYLFRPLENFKIEPSVNIRYLDYKILEYDFQTRIYVHHIHWMALTYRSYQALALMVGFKVRKFYVAYNFEVNLSPIIKYNGGTHGLHVGLNLGMRRLEGF